MIMTPIPLTTILEGAIKCCWRCGGGTNAVNRMIEEGIRDVEFVAVNTDAQALAPPMLTLRFTSVPDITKGLGAGANPEVGKEAAEDSRDEITSTCWRWKVFIMLARVAVLVPALLQLLLILQRMMLCTGIVGVVTKPFSLEGRRRYGSAADAGNRNILSRIVGTPCGSATDRLVDSSEVAWTNHA